MPVLMTILFFLAVFIILSFISNKNDEIERQRLDKEARERNTELAKQIAANLKGSKKEEGE